MNKSTLTRWVNKVMSNLKFDPQLEDSLKIIVRNKLQRYHKIKKLSGSRSDKRKEWLALSHVEKATKVVQGLIDFESEDSKFKSSAELINNTKEHYCD